ncbi:MAG: hypothetical protein WC700_08790 [Gemmatimonadaceae bacterium]
MSRTRGKGRIVGRLSALSRRTLLAITAVMLLAVRGASAQQYVLSPEPRTVISSETDPSAQFSMLLGVARFARGEIALATYDPLGMNVYNAGGALVKKLARAGEGPGELRMPQFLGRRQDSVVVFDLGLRRVTYFTVTGSVRQTRARLPQLKGHIPTVVGVMPSGALLVIQVPYTRPPSPDGPTRDRELLSIVPLDSAVPQVSLGTFAGYGLVYYTPPSEGEPHFLMDWLNPGTSWAVVGDNVFVADPSSPELLMFAGNGKLMRRVSLPVKPRPFDPKAVRDAREQLAPRFFGARRARSAARAAIDAAHFELMFDVAKRPRTAPYLRRLVRATDGGVWVELYREHVGLPSEYLRIDASGRVGGRLRGPPNVQFHEFGADYALGVREDPETDAQSVVLYGLRRE